MNKVAELRPNIVKWRAFRDIAIRLKIKNVSAKTRRLAPMIALVIVSSSFIDQIKRLFRKKSYLISAVLEHRKNT